MTPSRPPVWISLIKQPETDYKLEVSTLTAIRYWEETLGPIVRPSNGAVGPVFVLVKDNGEAYLAEVCRLLEDAGIDTLDWPPHWPDLHLREHFWDIMFRSIWHCQAVCQQFSILSCGISSFLTHYPVLIYIDIQPAFFPDWDLYIYLFFLRDNLLYLKAEKLPKNLHHWARVLVITSAGRRAVWCSCVSGQGDFAAMKLKHPEKVKCSDSFLNFFQCVL